MSELEMGTVPELRGLSPELERGAVTNRGEMSELEMGTVPELRGTVPGTLSPELERGAVTNRGEVAELEMGTAPESAVPESARASFPGNRKTACAEDAGHPCGDYAAASMPAIRYIPTAPVPHSNAYGSCVRTWSMWSLADAIDDTTVVSLIGEQ
jgi:hypothetical protein